MSGARTNISCASCKRRKKSCDYQKPSCSRCKHLNLRCHYERRCFIFVNKSNDYTITNNNNNKRHASLQAVVVHTGAQKSLLSTINELQVVAAFWNIYLPVEDPNLDGRIGGILAAPWIPTIRSLAIGDNNLRTAVSATACAALGWLQEDPALVERGLQLYSQALAKVNKALRDPSEVRNDITLASCRVLSLYEMLRRIPSGQISGQSQYAGWSQHVEGTCQLLQLRGRNQHLSETGLQLYDGVRITAIIQAFARRKSNVFHTLSWNIPEHKTMRDILFDLMEDTPDLLHASDLLMTRSAQCATDVERRKIMLDGCKLLTSYLELAERLHEWEQKSVELCRNDSMVHGLNSSQPLSTSSYSLSLAEASQSHGYGFFFACTQYWAMCVRILDSGLCLHQAIRALARQDDTLDMMLPQIPSGFDPEPHALHISQASSHYFEHQAGIWAAQSATFPLCTALWFFAKTGRRESPEFRQILQAFEHGKAGMIVKDFVPAEYFLCGTPKFG